MAGSGEVVRRQTVDLSGFPDLVVIYLGMRVRQPRGLAKLLQTGRQITAAVAQRPDGLLHHETMMYSLLPPHVGMRQYWRDLDALESWTRTLPHKKWWQEFLRDSAGTGFWHEAYFARGGMEAIYDDVSAPIGLTAFTPRQRARGRLFSARSRLGLGEAQLAAVVPEEALVDSPGSAEVTGPGPEAATRTTSR